jgi:hypothetical protein
MQAELAGALGDQRVDSDRGREVGLTLDALVLAQLRQAPAIQRPRSPRPQPQRGVVVRDTLAPALN